MILLLKQEYYTQIMSTIEPLFARYSPSRHVVGQRSHRV